MKKKLLLFILFLQGVAMLQLTNAQQLIYKEPILKIDFGSRGQPLKFDMWDMRNYKEQRGVCPDDGNYSFAAYTSDCFNGDWIAMNEDHTSGDYDGKMLLVNASPVPGTFFKYRLDNVKPNTMYEFSCWIVNVCRTSSPCNPTPPYINFIIQTNSGIPFKSIRTGTIPPTNAPSWRRYYGEFTTPAGVNSIVIRMDDETNGGCGNDFAIDDIMVREIEIKKPEPVIIPPPVKPVVTVAVPVNTPPAKKITPVKNEPTETAQPLKRNDAIITKDEIKAMPVVIKPAIKERAEKIQIPEVLLTRKNPVVKQIETAATEILIELYDNGEVDGDTVTIYHNNALLVSRAGLSEKPVSIKIKVGKDQPHHELVMVANNLGSIPPNTSLMIITANDKRYEVFISSSQQKNAKVLIDLKE
ncbi:MAG: hypothetical protein IPP72_17195 [Chitinophagaceae bacterium]|nr:hypothetical protein [Chitinophagaceae bacterium]